MISVQEQNPYAKAGRKLAAMNSYMWVIDNQDLEQPSFWNTTNIAIVSGVAGLIFIILTTIACTVYKKKKNATVTLEGPAFNALPTTPNVDF
jgi:hypothetical protein